MIVNYPANVASIEKKLDNIQTSLSESKWWENDWIQGLVVLGAIAGILALVFAFFPSISTITSLWPWLAVLAAGFFLSAFLIFKNQSPKNLVFVPSELGSFWNPAPQPDGRKLTQIHLRGHVTNISTKPLFLPAIDLIRPRTKRVHQKLIFTIHNNAVDSSDRPIRAGEMTEFDSHFFADGFIGLPKKPIKIVVLITDNLGKKYKVIFPNMREFSDR